MSEWFTFKIFITYKIFIANITPKKKVFLHVFMHWQFTNMHDAVYILDHMKF